MKTLKTLSRIATFTSLLLFISALALAQSKESKAVQISVGFSNTQYENLFSTEYEQGGAVKLSVRMASNDRLRLALAGQVDRNCLGCEFKVDTYAGGPELDVLVIGNRVAVFGHALFGLQTSYNNDKVFSRTYGGGVKVFVGNVFFVPGEINYRRVEGVPGGVQLFLVRVGARF
jgi:hypothetical protein